MHEYGVLEMLGAGGVLCILYVCVSRVTVCVCASLTTSPIALTWVPRLCAVALAEALGDSAGKLELLPVLFLNQVSCKVLFPSCTDF